MPKRKAPWREIEQRYIAGEAPSALAKEYGLHHKTVIERAEKEGWGETRAIAAAVKPAYEFLGKDCSENRAIVLNALQNGYPRSAAAALVGVHRNTLADWAKRDESFAAQMDAAEATHVGEMLGTVADSARKGTWQAGQAMLQAHRLTKADWRPQPAQAIQPAIQINIGGVERASSEPLLIEHSSHAQLEHESLPALEHVEAA